MAIQNFKVKKPVKKAIEMDIYPRVIVKGYIDSSNHAYQVLIKNMNLTLDNRNVCFSATNKIGKTK